MIPWAAVIRIGRRRVRAACTAVSTEATPLRLWRANSTIRIAFFGSQPDENNEADLRQDVDGHSAGEQAGSRSANPAS
jgi:hypothetical protein